MCLLISLLNYLPLLAWANIWAAAHETPQVPSGLTSKTTLSFGKCFFSLSGSSLNPCLMLGLEMSFGLFVTAVLTSLFLLASFGLFNSASLISDVVFLFNSCSSSIFLFSRIFLSFRLLSLFSSILYP